MTQKPETMPDPMGRVLLSPASRQTYRRGLMSTLRIYEILQQVEDSQWQALWEHMDSEASRILDVAADRFSEDDEWLREVE